MRGFVICSTHEIICLNLEATSIAHFRVNNPLIHLGGLIVRARDSYCDAIIVINRLGNIVFNRVLSGLTEFNRGRIL